MVSPRPPYLLTGPHMVTIRLFLPNYERGIWYKQSFLIVCELPEGWVQFILVCPLHFLRHLIAHQFSAANWVLG